MKYILLAVSVTFLLCACNDEKKDQSDSKVVKETNEQIDENSNELTYTINEKKKSVPAKLVNLSKAGKSIKVIEGFVSFTDSNGVSFSGTNELDGVSVTVKQVKAQDSAYSKEGYKELLRINGGKKIAEVKLPQFKKYEFAFSGEDNKYKRKYLFAQKSGESVYEVAIFIPKDKYDAELERKLLAMARSYEY